MEKIIEHKQCKKCGIDFTITDKDMEFYEKVSPSFWWKKFEIPTPTFCPNCRQQRRLTFRNERNLYKRKCDATGKDIISAYSPDKPYKIYEQDFWWSDKWDPIDYGRDFDFSHPFFTQFQDLLVTVPRLNSWIKNSENCDYTNFMKNGKDNYMSFASSESERVLYSVWTTRSINSVDCLYCNEVSESYESFQCHSSSNVFFSQYCNNSSFCFYSYWLENCHNCLSCSNLSNKSYCYKNKQYSKEEYVEIVSDYKKHLEPLVIKPVVTIPDVINSQNCTWSEMFNCKNCKHCFWVNDIENCSYCFEQFWWQKDCMDCLGSVWELCYESGLSVGSYKNISVIWSGVCNNTYYCDSCDGCNDIFGCISLRNKQYCIFNKQYTKEQYETLVPKIIEHMKRTWEWWEFFPSNISSFWYNETVANEYYSLSKKLALEKWFIWSDYEVPFPKVEKVIPANKLPVSIADIPDDILNWAIECEATKKPFRVIAQELEFYRKHNLPVPKRHPDQRHLDRMALRNPRKLFERNCDKCGIEMKTTYSPERPEKVYCEACYNKEIY